MKALLITALLALSFTATAKILTETEDLPAGQSTEDGMSSTQECPIIRFVVTDTETGEEKESGWFFSCDPNTYPDEVKSPFALPPGRTDVAFSCYQINSTTKRCFWVMHGALRYFDYYSPV